MGDKGPTGDQGPVGDKGPPGDPGSTGGSFVERPIELSLYGIAAAGLVRPDGSNHPFAVRELAGKVIAPGQAIFFFKGYTPPVETHQYVVKALLAYDIEFERRFELFSVSLIFDRFTDEGFVLRVLRGAQPVEEDVLARMGFMIEVSEYDTGLIRSAPPGATRTAAVRPAAKRRSRTARRSGK